MEDEDILEDEDTCVEDDPINVHLREVMDDLEHMSDLFDNAPSNEESSLFSNNQLSEIDSYINEHNVIENNNNNVEFVLDDSTNDLAEEQNHFIDSVFVQETVQEPLVVKNKTFDPAFSKWLWNFSTAKKNHAFNLGGVVLTSRRK